jgi:AraC-like DNA-binding protein
MSMALSKYQKLEGSLHLIFWIFIFTSVNVQWQQNWFDASIRQQHLSPLSVIVFPMLFYAHAYWAVPRFLSHRKWMAYGLSLVLIFIVPELLRIILFATLLNRPAAEEFSNRDSFLFGSLNIAWLAFIFSLLYRLLADRILEQKHSTDVDEEPSQVLARLPSIPPAEAEKLAETLSQLMIERRLFLQEDLKLGTLSEHLNIPEKMLSALLNQNMQTNFTDFVNKFRVDHFLREVESGKLQQLSVSGLMNESGFSSKATFYRAFKKVNGCTPTQWLRSK